MSANRLFASAVSQVADRPGSAVGAPAPAQQVRQVQSQAPVTRVLQIDEDEPQIVRGRNDRGRAGPSQGAFASDGAEKSIFDRFDDAPAGGNVGAPGAGPARRTRNQKRDSPYGYVRSDPDAVATWKHDMYKGPVSNVMSSVFVRNLPTNITEGQLRSLFSRHGIPVSSLKMDKGTQIPTATVYFERRDQAAMAEDLDGWEFGRNRIKVSLLDEARQTSIAIDVDEPTPRVARRKGRGFADARAEARGGGRAAGRGGAAAAPAASASNDPHHVSIFDRLT